ncbi:MAG: anthranilate phosphoribosyltransferase [Verrucomicrobiales bacterium]|jgi:anthranilate phosphoribosyltransferase
MSQPLSFLIEQLKLGTSLDPKQVDSSAALILDESIEVGAKADFLKALAGKGETPAEIAAFVDSFLGRAVDPGLDPDQVDGPMLDVCGTGGDKLDLFNVSTTCIFVLAAGGACVVKHGNRGITSKSGGADVLEALGVTIDLPPPECAEMIRRNGVGFMFAPIYHPAFKAVVPVRQQLATEGVRTIFNILGPLLNPARPAHQLIGVFDPELTGAFANILKALGRKSAWAVHGSTGDGRGMDELSVLAQSKVTQLAAGGEISDFQVDPLELGLPSASLEDLQGGDAEVNAKILVSILDGSELGAKRDIVTLNSAAGFVACGLAKDLTEGLERAAEAIDSGRALGKLKALQAG